MRQAGLADANPSHPKLQALLDGGISLDELELAAKDAVTKGKGFAYALATAEGRRRDAAASSTLPAKPEQPWFMRWSAIEAKGAELGIVKRDDELPVHFRDRIFLASGVTPEMVRQAKIDAGERP